MLLISCPYCGARPELEFSHGGEAHIARPADPSAVSDEAWAGYLYHRSNPRGLHIERWRHTHGCGRFFNCVRDTVSDEILATYRAGEAPPDLTTLVSSSSSPTPPSTAPEAQPAHSPKATP